MILFERGVPLLMPNKFGARGIHTAARKGHVINNNNDNLHIYNREGHVSVIDKLIKNGEAVDSKTGDGKTALHLAVEVGNFLSALIFHFLFLVWQGSSC